MVNVIYTLRTYFYSIPLHALTPWPKIYLHGSSFLLLVWSSFFYIYVNIIFRISIAALTKLTLAFLFYECIPYFWEEVVSWTVLPRHPVRCSLHRSPLPYINVDLCFFRTSTLYPRMLQSIIMSNCRKRNDKITLTLGAEKWEVDG